MAADKLTTIAFDADDTLWHNEKYFTLTQERFAELLSDYTDRDTLMDRLLDAEYRNLPHYGFGVKGFILSMIETALEVTECRVPGEVIAQLLESGQEMLASPIELLPYAAEAVSSISEQFKVILITKGDLLDQERKLAQSGLGDAFDAVEIVSDKTPEVFTRLFRKHAQGPACGLMVGNSIRSDVIPMLDAGGWGVHVPHGLEWGLESAEAPEDHPRFEAIEDLSELPALVEDLAE
ncbi:MAG: HAD family hydrolase [Sulfitobacter sp.]